eukprot:8179100-Heterocapsa_arctica.AAC.1
MRDCIACCLTQSYHLCLGLPTLRKSACTLEPSALIEHLFMTSFSSALSRCPNRSGPIAGSGNDIVVGNSRPEF